VKAAAFTLLPALLFGQGGPPFKSDDPATPGNKHWEINLGFMGERNAFGGSYTTPNIDVNYGLGNRIQLKYEVPLSIQETRGTEGHVTAGPGNSLLGVKYRFYQRHSRTPEPGEEREVKFGVSIYPQIVLSHPTRSVARDIVEPGPQLLLPLEASARIGPISMSGEVGYWFSSKDVPNSWISGVVVGHEFRKETEIYLELYDQEDVRAAVATQSFRDSTVGLGGRVPVVKGHWLRLIGMGGRGIVSATPANGQPNWTAYVGIQFLSDRRRRHLAE